MCDDIALGIGHRAVVAVVWVVVVVAVVVVSGGSCRR
jgi:hypothetical protein